MKIGSQSYEFHITVRIERAGHSATVTCNVRGQLCMAFARFDTFGEAENFAAEQVRLILRDEKS